MRKGGRRIPHSFLCVHTTERSLMWQEDRGGKFTYHREHIFFVYSSQDGLILAFALRVYLKAGENGECLRS